MNAIVDVLDRVRNLLMLGISSLSLVMLTVGGVRYVFAGGDPEGIRGAKHTVRNALLGFALALLAPVLIEVVKAIVGK
jgi:hypothetical protein